MKRLVILSALLFLPLVAAAQEATLLDDDITHGGYGGLITTITPINGQAALMLGAEGVWIINSTVYVGVQGSGIVNRVDAAQLQSGGKPYLMWMNETGGRVGYIYRSNDLVHFSAGAMIGAGSLQLADRYFWTDPRKVDTYGDEDFYFIAAPEVAAELNITKWMRAKATASYRIVSGVETEATTDGDLSGPAGSLTLMFGSF